MSVIAMGPLVGSRNSRQHSALPEALVIAFPQWALDWELRIVCNQ
jgi:hypothetical protein